jgi:5-deoxy-glucuronate isomerase
LTSTFLADKLVRWRSASLQQPYDEAVVATEMTPQKLHYRSARVPRGRTAAALNLTPRALGWDRIHFAVRHLAAGAVWSGLSRDEERCLVLLRGEFEVSWAGASHRIGPRADVFSAYPHAVYLPARTPFRIVAREACEIADARAVSKKILAPRVIRPEDCGYEIRGGGNATRQIIDIVPPAFSADRLLICEVFTPGGNWSSYPPHKHDTDDPPREVDLEEIYYFRYRDPNGFGFHRVYNQRRDETVRITHGDVVAVRDGFHPFVTAHGYDAYYLNVLAGERRSMAASDDPRYAHVRHQWPTPDPRLPLVPKPEDLR